MKTYPLIDLLSAATPDGIRVDGHLFYEFRSTPFVIEVRWQKPNGEPEKACFKHQRVKPDEFGVVQLLDTAKVSHTLELWMRVPVAPAYLSARYADKHMRKIP